MALVWTLGNDLVMCPITVCVLAGADGLCSQEAIGLVLVYTGDDIPGRQPADLGPRVIPESGTLGSAGVDVGRYFCTRVFASPSSLRSEGEPETDSKAGSLFKEPSWAAGAKAGGGEEGRRQVGKGTWPCAEC